jgi:hypothetical protein
VVGGSLNLIQLGASPDVNRSGFRVTLARSAAVVSKSGLSAGILCPPLALAYLAASVRDRGYSVSIVDPVGESHQEVHQIPGRNAVVYGWNIQIRRCLVHVFA